MGRRWSRRIAPLLIAVVASMLLAAPSLADTYRIRAAGTVVNAHWEPDERHISQGDKIKFVNRQDVRHNVHGYRGWDFHRALPADSAFRKTFNNAGTYRFRCRIHSDVNDGVCSGMCGKVVVH